MRLYWTCEICGEGIDDDPHTIDETGGDCHPDCCPWCHDDRRVMALTAWAREPYTIAGHPGPTQDQAARAETA